MSDSSTVVLFEGGLDMVTPVQNTEPGTLVDCLNYEVGPIKGYRRIDGYERFAGGHDGGIDSVYKLVGHPTNSDPAYTPVPGSIITKNNSGIAIVVKVGVGNVMYVVLLRPEANITTSNHPFRIVPPQGIGSSNFVVDEDMVDARDAGLSFQEFSEAIRDGQAFLRGQVPQAPGRIAGVYRGRHRTYVAVDAVYVDSPLRRLQDGMYVRLHGNAYRVIWETGLTLSAWLVRLNITPSSDNGLELVTYEQLVNGTGNYETVTGYTVDDDAAFAQFAQMFYVDGSYVPIGIAPVVSFKDGKQEFQGKVRLSDGTNYSTHDVVGYSVFEGSFSDGDAVGVLHLADGIGSNNYTGEIHTLATITSEDGITELATIESIDMPYLPGTSTLRSRSAIGEQRYFYQWGTYNFKATAGHEYVFTTNGISNAVWIRDSEDRFDCTWGNIATGRVTAQNTPKFLAYHAEQRLLLAYADGSIELSAVGDPFNFSGLDGAIELGNGDSITGVLEASGDTTLVFGPRTIRRLVGMGTDIAFNTISSSSGALPYTACVVAGVPTYVNHNGICVLDQTSAYGDFKNSSVSGAIDPYLTPRVIFEFNRAEATGTLCAYPVRAKNQYRLLMQNGDVVSMSLTQQGPQFTKSSYTSAAGGRRIPIAYSSSVGNDGKEYILSVWDEALVYSITDAPNMQMIYRMDHGWGFDGETFEHFIDTAYMFNENPQFLTIDKCVLYGMGYGEASLRLMAFGVEDDFYQAPEITTQDISMPRNPEVYSASLKRVLGEVDHANWGRAVKLRFANIKDAGEDEVEPPHILQSVRLFVQTDGITE